MTTSESVLRSFLMHEHFQNGVQETANNPSLGKVCSIVWASGTFGFLSSPVIKNPANAGDATDAGLIPRSGRSPGVGNGNLLQFSCQHFTHRGA